MVEKSVMTLPSLWSADTLIGTVRQFVLSSSQHQHFFIPQRRGGAEDNRKQKLFSLRHCASAG
jgi:hypothetical protein